VALNGEAEQTVDIPVNGRVMASPPSPSVFDYLDYRAYLRDYYLERKRRRGLSYRGFSRRVGLKSSNFFKLVLDGERNLTGEMAVRFADAIGLSGDARDFFMELVRFDQARTTDARNASYAKLTGYRRYRRARPLEIKHATYHSTWYLPAIRELAASPEFQEAPSWIAATLRPTISPAEAEKG